MRKRFPLTFSLILLAFIILMAGCAQVDVPAPYPGPVILTDTRSEYPLGRYLDILEDPTGQLTIDDVASPDYEARFVPSQEEVPNFGFTDSVIWIRLRLKSEASSNTLWWLEVGFANMHYADLYAPLPDGSGFSHKQNGIMRPFATRDLLHHLPIFVLSPLPHQEQTFYLRFQSEDSLTLPLTLRSAGAFMQKDSREQLAVGLFYGVLLAMLGYNLFLFLSLRDKSYLLYLLFMSGILLFQVAISGRANQYFGPGWAAWSYFLPPLLAGLALFGLVSFTSTFLKTSKHAPQIHQVLLGLGAAWLLLALLAPFVHYRFLAMPVTILAIITCLVVLIAGLATWRQGYRPARYFVLAVLVFLMATISFSLVRLGFLPSTSLTEDSPRLGMMWLVVLLSLALADRINLLKAEAEQSNRALRESEGRLNQFLDALPVGIIIVDAGRKLHYVNQWVRQAFEWPDQTIALGHTWDEVLACNAISLKLAGSDEPYPPERRPFLLALQGQEATLNDMELTYQGQRIPLEVWTRPIFDEQGRVTYAVSAFQDISLRRQTEATLRELNEKLEQRVAERTSELAQETGNLATLQRATQEITTSLELEQVYRAAHRAAEQLMPVDAFVIALLDEARQEVEDVYLFDQDQRWPNARHPLGRGLTSFVITSGQSLHLDDDCHEGKKLDIGTELFGTNEDTCSVLALPLRLGNKILGAISAQAYPSYAYTASHLQLLETLANQVSISIANARLYEQAQQEVAERQRAEAELRASEERYRAVVENQTEVISRLTADGAFLFVNDVYCRFFGKTREELVGNKWQPIALPEDVHTVEEKLSLLSPQQPVVVIENRVYSGQHEVHWMQFVNRGFFDPTGQLVEIQSVGRDITERKQAEAALRQAHDELDLRVKQRTTELRRANTDLRLEIVERQRVEASLRHSQEQLKASLKEKNLLLQEIHHRVKNNLQIVVSLLRFQGRAIYDPATRDLLQESQNRVRSMALIHEKLYQAPDLAHVNFADYVRSLTGYLFRSYGVDPAAYTLTLNVEDVFLTIEVGVPCGLIINELVSNSIKYAFPGGPEPGAEIYIGLEASDQGLKLRVGDNGVGLSGDLETQTGGSLGLQLVQMLVEQLEGTLTLESGPRTMFVITFAAR